MVRVRGAEVVQGPRMGFFSWRNLTHDGKPVYENTNGQFLFYWGPFQGWRIGDSFTSPFAGLKSMAGEAAACPNEATGWTAYAGPGWTTEYDIEISEATALPSAIEEAATLPEAATRQRLRPAAGGPYAGAQGLSALILASTGLVVAASCRRGGQVNPEHYSSLGMPVLDINGV